MGGMGSGGGQGAWGQGAGAIEHMHWTSAKLIADSDKQIESMTSDVKRAGPIVRWHNQV